MPTRSPGCFSCRKRKIRCDEGRPGCQRCATHGITCPGYRGDKDGGIEFMDQTGVTVDRARGMFKRGGGKNGKVGRIAVRGPKGGSGRSGSEGVGVASVGKVEAWSSDWSTASNGEEDWTTSTFSPSSGSSLALTPSYGTQYYPDQNPTISALSLHHYSPFTMTLLSPAVERTALYQSFISTYMPRKTLPTIQEGHYTFFHTLAAQRSTHPALEQSFDALSLVQIGSTYHAPHLLQQATRQYALALRSLGRSIARGDFLHDDQVLAAVVVLSSCELYEGIQTEGQGWGNHVAGANQLLAARGPETLQSELSLLLFANMRHGSMCHALISRKAPFMAREEWRNVAWRVPLRKDQSTLFYEWGIRVPGLLERHDALDLEDETALEEIDAILEDSMGIELELREWFACWTTVGAVEFGGLCELVSYHPIPDIPRSLRR